MTYTPEQIAAKVKGLRGINRMYELARGVHFEIKEAADMLEQLAAALAIFKATGAKP